MRQDNIVVSTEQFGPVTRIRLGRRLLGKVRQAVNVYWVDGMLIDSGAPRLAPALLHVLNELGLTVEQLVNTHAHEDHIGANAALMERYGVTGRIHPLGVKTVQQPPDRLPLYRAQAWGVPSAAPAEALREGEMIRTDRYRFTVIHTPGHAPEHIVFYEPDQRWVFTGDLYLSPSITLVMAREDPLTLLDSMKRVATLPIRQLFCDHARDVPDSAAPLLEKIDRWEHLRAEAGALAAAGWSVPRIARALLGPMDPLELVSAGEYKRSHLIRGLLGQQTA